MADRTMAGMNIGDVADVSIDTETGIADVVINSSVAAGVAEVSVIGGEINASINNRTLYLYAPVKSTLADPQFVDSVNTTDTRNNALNSLTQSQAVLTESINRLYKKVAVIDNRIDTIDREIKQVKLTLEEIKNCLFNEKLGMRS